MPRDSTSQCSASYKSHCRSTSSCEAQQCCPCQEAVTNPAEATLPGNTLQTKLSACPSCWYLAAHLMLQVNAPHVLPFISHGDLVQRLCTPQGDGPTAAVLQDAKGSACMAVTWKDITLGSPTMQHSEPMQHSRTGDLHHSQMHRCACAWNSQGHCIEHPATTGCRPDFYMENICSPHE